MRLRVVGLALALIVRDRRGDPPRLARRVRPGRPVHRNVCRVACTSDLHELSRPRRPARCTDRRSPRRVGRGRQPRLSPRQPGDRLGARRDGRGESDCFERHAARETFQRNVVNIMASNRVDAICFPTCQVVPPTRKELNAGKWPCLQFPTNTLIGAQTWMPAMSVPAGFTGEGLPVGLEFLALPYGEPTLFKIASGFEHATRARRAPASAPEL